MNIKIIFLTCTILIVTVVACMNTKTKTISDQLDSKAIYKILPPENYDSNNSLDSIKLMPIDIESGFIHTSFGNQVNGVLTKFFKGNKRVLLLELDQAKLKNSGLELKVEANKPGGDLFPHLYGKQQIPASTVKSKVTAVEQQDGTWVISLHN